MAGQDVFARTIWAEARGEPREGQVAVARVIRERAAQNRRYWGGSRIEDVCRHPGQFECWNNVAFIDLGQEEHAYWAIRRWSDAMYNEPLRSDPYAPDHYNNPDIEGYPPWTGNCVRMFRIGNHQFYRSMN